MPLNSASKRSYVQKWKRSRTPDTQTRKLVLLFLLMAPMLSFYEVKFEDRIVPSDTFPILTSTSNSDLLSNYKFKFWSYKRIQKGCYLDIVFPSGFFEFGLGLSGQSSIFLNFDFENEIFLEDVGSLVNASSSSSAQITGNFVGE